MKQQIFEYLVFALLLLLSIFIPSCAQKTTPRKEPNGIKVDEYTKRLVKEMQGQGVPKEAIVDRIKYAAKGSVNAKKIIDHVSEEKMKADARAKQKRQQSKPSPQKAGAKNGNPMRREL